MSQKTIFVEEKQQQQHSQKLRVEGVKQLYILL